MLELRPEPSLRRRWPSRHCWFGSSNSIEPVDLRCPEKLRRLPSFSEPDSLRRCRERWRRFRCELCERPEPRDNSLSLSDVRRFRWRLNNSNENEKLQKNARKNLKSFKTNLLHAFESFDEWLSTELDRTRCVGTLEFFLDDADRTDLGLEFTPNNPFCWDRDQGALRVLRGESGALVLP